MNTNYMPLDMVGQALHLADTVAECQALCANTTGCAHFSYWQPMKHCHLADAEAALMTGEVFFISGPPKCGQEKEPSGPEDRVADLSGVAKDFLQESHRWATPLWTAHAAAGALCSLAVVWLLMALAAALRKRASHRSLLMNASDPEDLEAEEPSRRWWEGLRHPGVGYGRGAAQA